MKEAIPKRTSVRREIIVGLQAYLKATQWTDTFFQETQSWLDQGAKLEESGYFFLLWEDALYSLQPPPENRQQFRKQFWEQHKPLLEDWPLRVILSPRDQQFPLMSGYFLRHIWQGAKALLGTQNSALQSFLPTIEQLLQVPLQEPPFGIGLEGTIHKHQVQQFAQQLFLEIAKRLGSHLATRLYTDGYLQFSQQFFPGFAPASQLNDLLPPADPGPDLLRQINLQRRQALLQVQMAEAQTEALLLRQQNQELGKKQIVWEAQRSHLERSMEKLDHIANLSNVGLLQTNGNLEILYANQMLANWWGYPRKQLIGMNFAQLIEQPAPNHFLHELSRHHRTNDPRWLHKEIQMEGINLNQRAFPIVVNISETVWANQRMYHFVIQRMNYFEAVRYTQM